MRRYKFDVLPLGDSPAEMKLNVIALMALAMESILKNEVPPDSIGSSRGNVYIEVKDIQV